MNISDKNISKWGQGIQVILPKFGHGYLYSYCSELGLCYQLI